MCRGGLAGEDEDTGADDGADPESGQVGGGENALEAMLAATGGFSADAIDLLGRKQRN